MLKLKYFHIKTFYKLSARRSFRNKYTVGKSDYLYIR